MLVITKFATGSDRHSIAVIDIIVTSGAALSPRLLISHYGTVCE